VVAVSGERHYHTRHLGNESEEITGGEDIDRPLICYPDMFGTEITCYETDETRSAAQFKDGFVFEGRGPSLEEI